MGFVPGVHTAHPVLVANARKLCAIAQSQTKCEREDVDAGCLSHEGGRRESV
jgi:hypothetical protein